MDAIVIAGAARTPIGAFNGALSTLPAHALGEVVIREALTRAGTDPAEVTEVILGQVLTAGQGQNPARQAAVNAGIPVEKSAFGINQVCGSGLRAVALGHQAIREGDAEVMVVGGQESMSLSPHVMHLRTGTKMGPAELVDTMIKDGLWEAFHGYHMGTTAENVAKAYGLTREAQDAFAAASQQKAEAAITAGRFRDEIAAVTVKGRKGEVVVDTDEHPKFGTTVAALAKLRPAFSKDGTVTAGNASGINDGAAALVLMTAGNAARRGVEPLARIASWAA
ncbi:acetyl-CoA C-acyltransferase, partial [Azospirillum sp. A39]